MNQILDFKCIGKVKVCFLKLYLVLRTFRNKEEKRRKKECVDFNTNSSRVELGSEELSNNIIS